MDIICYYALRYHVTMAPSKAKIKKALYFRRIIIFHFCCLQKRSWHSVLSISILIRSKHWEMMFWLYRSLFLFLEKNCSTTVTWVYPESTLLTGQLWTCLTSCILTLLETMSHGREWIAMRVSGPQTCECITHKMYTREPSEIRMTEHQSALLTLMVCS